MMVIHFTGPVSPQLPAQYKNKGAKVIDTPDRAWTIVKSGELILATHFESTSMVTVLISFLRFWLMNSYRFFLNSIE